MTLAIRVLKKNKALSLGYLCIDLGGSDGASDADSWHSENFDKVLESDEESPAVYPQFNEKTKFGLLKFEVIMIFKSKSEFMQAIRDYTIQWGRNILFTKNNKLILTLVQEGGKTELQPKLEHLKTSYDEASRATGLFNGPTIKKKNSMKFMAGQPIWWLTWESTHAAVAFGNSQVTSSTLTYASSTFKHDF
ncbi:hypothetical protein Ahy_B03g061972 [Arachis hypogaea]|uniref:Uncharacterized protein n=1 Tax=Arachis hypogaea TaxID=3818 RepID=A0A444ZSN1_ARAHY|nr:hypothetical protein Ahy_B03g061972 [Arachis hypogaea]